MAGSTVAQLLRQRCRQLAGEGHQAGGGVQLALGLAVGQGGGRLALAEPAESDSGGSALANSSSSGPCMASTSVRLGSFCT